MSDEKSFLARWSERKRAEDIPTPAPAVAPAPAPEPDTRPDEDILAEAGLPDPATLGPGDDFTGFMAREIPAHLRRRALRTLWASNPALANLDGLVEYGEDYTDAATVVEKLQTAYQVGKGMLARLEEIAEEAEAAEPEPKPEPEPEATDDIQAESSENTEDQPFVSVAPHPIPADPGTEIPAPTPPQDPATLPPRPRRITFHFDD